MILESLNSWDVLLGLGIHTSLNGADISVGGGDNGADFTHSRETAK